MRFSSWLYGTLAVVLVFSTGCGDSAPPRYEIQGKVTLGGKPYERLIAYFRPANAEITIHNMAVGETDKEGNLKVQGSTGTGLPAGEYKVTFTCNVPKKKTAAAEKLTGDDKPSELGIEMMELVPDSHVEAKANDTTPARLTVTSTGENVFNYDIPLK